MQGHGGADVFQYTSSIFGSDTILGWVDGEDLLDFTAAGLGFADFTISTAGGGTLIELTANPLHSVFLDGFTGTIDASDFA